MHQQSIGKLQRVPLREVWKHEARDFTQWLQENIDVLNSALNLSLINVEREQAAGAFSIDLVAEEESGGTVIIENQLEKSDHDHLGKVITYLTVIDARAAVWIVSEPRQEHVAAISWLNEETGADFYLLKVEAVRIGDSPPAPLLTLIVGPSAETKSVGLQKKEIAARSNIRYQWWAGLVARPDARLHAHISPSRYSWISVSTGIRGLSYNYVVNKDESAAELYIDRGKDMDEENKAIFDQLFSEREEIESKLSHKPLWDYLDGRRSCRVRITVQGGYRSPDEEWGAIQGRMVDAMNELEAVFQPKIQKLRLRG